MAESMTGFGRGLASSPAGTMTVEIKTVNSRFLELNFRTDGAGAAAEDLARQEVRQAITRGKAYISLRFVPSSEGAVQVVLDRKMLEAQAEALKEAQKLSGVKKGKITLSDLLALPGAWLQAEKIPAREEDMLRLARDAVGQALSGLKEMRAREGAALVSDLEGRLRFLREKLAVMKAGQNQVTEAYEARLRSRITVLAGEMGFAPDEGRIMEEVAILSEKADYTEELVRFESHLAQFDHALAAAGPVGRKLDFLLQEINREVNTMASKANDLTVVDTVIAVKTELEKVREQVQNLE